MDLAELSHAIEADAVLGALLPEVRPRLADDPGHDLQHCLRVALWTLKLGGDAVDFRQAVAAALLHDIVNLPKDSPERARASELSADEARRLLGAYDFTADAIEEIASAVRDHSYSRGATPQSALGRALQDADRLEALGALGLLRTVSTGTRMGARYFHASDPWAEARDLDDLSHMVDHFFTKLLALPASMNTAAGRAEAERRAAFLRVFLEQLAEELGVALSEARTRP